MSPVPNSDNSADRGAQSFQRNHANARDHNHSLHQSQFQSHGFTDSVEASPPYSCLLHDGAASFWTPLTMRISRGNSSHRDEPISARASRIVSLMFRSSRPDATQSLPKRLLARVPRYTPVR
ncbi:hypothetical protein HGRIS_012354 [Hohenbuehelia grisea]|uniref:Uncharacterized protein n=1 Tax=Hohenbuehelia grisea TaxID=104357 RepID=A0ABR3IS19_9AGAR